MQRGFDGYDTIGKRFNFVSSSSPIGEAEVRYLGERQEDGNAQGW